MWLGPQAQQKETSIHEKKSIKVDVRQAEMSTETQASAGGTDGEEGEWASAGVPGS